MDALTQVVRLAPYLHSGFLVLAAIAIASYVYLVRHVVDRQIRITEPVLKAVSAYRWLPITACVLATAGLGTEILRVFRPIDAKEHDSKLDPLDALSERVQELEGALRLKSGNSPEAFIRVNVNTKKLFATTDSHGLVDGVTKEQDGLYKIHFKNELKKGYAIVVSATTGYATVTANTVDSVMVKIFDAAGVYKGDCEFFIVIFGSIKTN